MIVAEQINDALSCNFQSELLNNPSPVSSYVVKEA